MNLDEFIQSSRFDILGAATGLGLRDGSSQKADESGLVPQVVPQSLT
jgi:hypothetical protein